MTVLEPTLMFNFEQDADTSFDKLFTEHYDRVYGLLFRLVGTRSEAEDLAQEVFLKLYNTPPKRADSNVGAWLYSVATNTGYNAIRSRKRRWQRDTLLLQEPHDAPASPTQQVIAKEEQAAVRAALSHLKPAQSQLLLLRQMGLSYQELAEACDVNPNSVGQLLARAAKAFKAAYISETPEKNHA